MGNCMCGGLSNCMNCGIAEPSGNEENKYCVKYNKYISGQELHEENQCRYFIRPIVEDGEVLTALQHLLVKEAANKTPVLNLNCRNGLKVRG